MIAIIITLIICGTILLGTKYICHYTSQTIIERYKTDQLEIQLKIIEADKELPKGKPKLVGLSHRVWRLNA